MNNHIFSTMDLCFRARGDQELKASSCQPQPAYWVHLLKEGDHKEGRKQGRREEEYEEKKKLEGAIQGRPDEYGAVAVCGGAGIIAGYTSLR